MEFIIKNINSNLDFYSLENDTWNNRRKLKKIEKKCEAIINSIITYFKVAKNLETETIYFILKDKKSDFWDKYFFHCILLSTTEILIENDDFNNRKAISRSISMYHQQLKEMIKHKGGGTELISLRLDLIKSKTEMNLIFVSKMFENEKKYL